MMNPDDIEAIGSLDLGQRQLLGLSEPWENLTNIRLKQDGNYTYWKPRGGTEDEGLSVSNHSFGTFFKARVEGDVNDYFARQKDNGDVTIYQYPSWTEVTTISGFTTTGKVEVVPIGELVYLFDGSQGKYVNLRTEIVSDYMSLDSTPITDYQDMTAQDFGSIFAVSEGDRAIAFPPNLSDLNKNDIFYDVYNADDQFVEESSKGGIDSQTWGDGYTFRTELEPNIIYAFKPGEGDNFSSTFIESLSFGQTDPDGYYFFRVDSPSTVVVENTESDITMPQIEVLSGYASISTDLSSLTGDFYQVQLSSIGSVDGSLRAYFDNGNSVDIDSDLWTIVEYDESLESVVGERMYRVKDSVVSTDEVGDSDGANTDIMYFDFAGSIVFSSTDKYYRQYICVDILDDGSVCIPGRPILVERDPLSDTIGVELSFNTPADNVTKRYLCGTRYKRSIDEVFKPTSSDSPNSPLFIIKEVDVSKGSVYDFSENSFLTRPITEILPMTSGIPAIFGTKQLMPKTVAGLANTFSIGGYTINRPFPEVYSSDATGGGNIHVNRSGGATSKTATIYFEYTDGNYSRKETIDLLDSSNEVIIHGLNTLVTSIHIFLDDGTTEYKLESYQYSDAEFGGAPFELPTDFSGLTEASIPTDLNVVETVNLDNYITIPIPPQTIQIASQARTFGNNPIVDVVPLDYDPYKSPLRFRLQIFTENNIQVGYITETNQESIVYYDSDFEIMDEARRALKTESIHHVGGSIFFQDSNGIHAISGGQADKVIPKEQYDFLTNDLVSVVYNEAEDELWFLFGGSEVYVIDSEDGYRSVFDFGSLSLKDAQWFDNKLHLLTSDKVCEADREGVTSDLGNNIVSTATSQYLSDQRIQMILHEVLTYGIGGDVKLYIDEGHPRFETNDSNPTDFEFSSSTNFSQITNEIYGALFTPRARGIRPRIKLELTGDFQIEDIELKTSSLASEGNARLEP